MKIKFILLLFSYAISYAQDTLRIGLAFNLAYANIECIYSEFNIKNEKNSSISGFAKNLSISHNGSLLVAKLDDSTIITGKNLYLFSNNASIRNYRINNKSYSGNFMFKLSGGIDVVNYIRMESYLQGVLEFEMGKGAVLESYKAQAVISRTYAKANLGRHWEQGFDLCTEQHCQVYNSNDTTDAIIISAIERTKGVFLKDKANAYCNTVFHANCGGQTANSEEIWVERVHYLRAVKDPYCSNCISYRSSIEIPFNQFITTLQNFSSSNSRLNTHFTSVKLISRKKDFVWQDIKVPYEDLRKALGLKTNFFDFEKIGSSLKITTKGFGHGVGLCQQGAIVMGRKGFNFQKILRFYYQGIRIVKEY